MGKKWRKLTTSALANLFANTREEFLKVCQGCISVTHVGNYTSLDVLSPPLGGPRKKLGMGAWGTNFPYVRFEPVQTLFQRSLKFSLNRESPTDETQLSWTRDKARLIRDKRDFTDGTNDSRKLPRQTDPNGSESNISSLKLRKHQVASCRTGSGNHNYGLPVLDSVYSPSLESLGSTRSTFRERPGTKIYFTSDGISIINNPLFEVVHHTSSACCVDTHV